MVGAVLAAPAGRVLAEGWHERFGGPHAEVRCFEDAERRGVTEAEIHEATLYVSLEPCSHYGKTPPCAELILKKRPKRVVVGMLDPNPLVSGRGVRMLRDAGIEVVTGMLEQDCRKLNKRFLCLMEKHRPYVILKWAQTKDGFIDRRVAGDEGPLVISSPLTKQLVHKMRAENMAIMVGTRTALLDNPSLLTTRWPGRNPIRVVVDRHHRIPKDAKIFSPDAPTIVYDERTDWPFILQDLAARGIHSILVEGGPTLLNHILATGIWDEMHIEVAPVSIGNGVPAPDIVLPDTYETVDGAKLYTIYQPETQNCNINCNIPTEK